MTHIPLSGTLLIGPYKGYRGRADYDPEVGEFHGRVSETKDIVTFVGRTPKELETAFKDSIDDYLEFCEARGVQPEKPFSGRFVIRISPEIHYKLAVCANDVGKSLNQYVADTLAATVRTKQPSDSPPSFARGAAITLPSVTSPHAVPLDQCFVTVSLQSRQW